MEITIRKADAADLDAVVQVYEHVHDAEEAGPAQVGWVGAGRVPRALHR